MGAALGEASDLLQVGLQVDAAQDMADMREDVMALMQEQGDAARAEREALDRKLDEVLQRQKAQWGSANEHAQLQRGDLDALMGEMRAAMAQMSLAARKDPSATAADLGVRAKVALVVGVAAYEGQPLRNPVNDARDVALALRACDFSVELALDVTLEGFEEAKRRFENRLAAGTLALFYFAGHGLEHAGENYLLMRDAPRGMDEKQVRRKALPVREVVQGMGDRQCAFQLVILDACRTAPVRRTGRNAGIKGLAKMEVPAMEDGGVVIAYATAPGEEARDREEGEDEAGEGRNGLYTRHLLQHLRKPMPVRAMLEEVQFAVEAASGKKQKPWLHSRVSSHEVQRLQLVDGGDEGKGRQEAAGGGGSSEAGPAAHVVTHRATDKRGGA